MLVLKSYWTDGLVLRYFLQIHENRKNTAEKMESTKVMESEEMQITNVMEYEEIAKKKLPKMVYDYYASGAEDQWTLKENQHAFSKIL